MKKTGIFTTIALLITSSAIIGAEKETIEKIDSQWHKTYRSIYTNGLTPCTVKSFRENAILCKNELRKAPDDYELLWRYARAAAQYAESAQAQRKNCPGWEKICRKYGLDGFYRATQACNLRPGNPEPFFWRNYCMGKYVLVGGVKPFVNAITEGFLDKSEESVIKGYNADKSYLDHIPVFARFQFLSHLPSVPILVKGSKEDRFKEAMIYFNEHRKYISGREKKIFEWDIRAPYTAEFIHMAIEVLKIKGNEKHDLLTYAEQMCKIGLNGPRSYYVSWSRKLLSKTLEMKK